MRINKLVQWEGPKYLPLLTRKRITCPRCGQQWCLDLKGCIKRSRKQGAAWTETTTYREGLVKRARKIRADRVFVRSYVRSLEAMVAAKRRASVLKGKP